MEILIKIVQFLANTLHTDDKTVVIGALVVIGILLVIQIVKKLIKLAVIVFMCGCIVVGAQYATTYLDDNYGIQFNSEAQTITMDIQSDYQQSDTQLLYSTKEGILEIYNNGVLQDQLKVSDIKQVNITESDGTGLVSIGVNGRDSDIAIYTSYDKAKIIYSVFNTMNLQNDVQMKISQLQK